MANIYVQVDYSTGNIFQFSKEQKEGYESHKNSKGVESWRKVYNKGLYAKLKGVSVRDSNFGKEISIATEDKDGNNVYLNLPLFDQRKNIASYAESFITVLPQLVAGEQYRFYAYNIQDENSKYAKVGISVVTADIKAETVDKENSPRKLSYTYTKDGVEVKGDIPAVLWEEDYTGARTMNSVAKSKFLYDTLLKHTGEQPAAPASAPAAPSAPAAKAPTAKAPVKEEEIDDLPF